MCFLPAFTSQNRPSGDLCYYHYHLLYGWSYLYSQSFQPFSPSTGHNHINTEEGISINDDLFYSFLFMLSSPSVSFIVDTRFGRLELYSLRMSTFTNSALYYVLLGHLDCMSSLSRGFPRQQYHCWSEQWLF